MSGRFARGLVVGKFCPLHRGHELLIETAQSRCDELVLISYTKPEFARCDPATRARWLGERFPRTRRLVIDDEALHALCTERNLARRRRPHNEAPDTEHREFCAWLCKAILGVAIDAVFTSEDYGEGFASALGAAQGRSVTHVAVDPARAAVPASGSAIRADPHAHRAWLSPEVYTHFVERVCVLGGESSGKTTLAQALARKLGTCMVPEYGRELWMRQEGQLEFDDLLHIAEHQLARERELARHAARWLVCDTSALTTLGYSLWMFGRADERLRALAAEPYDQVLLCDGDFGFVQDGTRRDEAFRAAQQVWYLQQFAERGIGFTLLQGSLERRVRSACSALGEKNCSEDSAGGTPRVLR